MVAMASSPLATTARASGQTASPIPTCVMSEIDTSFSSDERSALISELRIELAAFIAGGTTERVGVVDNVAALLNLSRRDLMKVAAIHFALSDPVKVFVASLREGLRAPVSDTARPLIVGSVSV